MKDKRIRGSVTIEASIALTFFMFFILTFLSFGSYYKAQNAMKHSLNQAAKTIALEHQWSETVDNLPFNFSDEIEKVIATSKQTNVPTPKTVGSAVATLLVKTGAGDADALSESTSLAVLSALSAAEALRTNAEVSKTVKPYMAYYLTGEKPENEAKADEMFASMGIYDVKILNATVDKDNKLITFSVSYTIHTGLSFFADDLEFSEAISIKLF